MKIVSTLEEGALHDDSKQHGAAPGVNKYRAQPGHHFFYLYSNQVYCSRRVVGSFFKVGEQARKSFILVVNREWVNVSFQ